MEITGKVFCLFEQSGIFKNAFKDFGISASDVDICNSFGETDYVLDIFREIEAAYVGERSIFDYMFIKDLVIAFFPCIYFEAQSQLLFSWSTRNYQKLTTREKTQRIIERSEHRQRFYVLLIKLCTICKERGLRLIVENPFGSINYLRNNFLLKPAIIDTDRTLRGDMFKKPTAYWFINCEPTAGMSLRKRHRNKYVTEQQGNRGGGMCSIPRSVVAADYAEAFIADYILGKQISTTQPTLNF